MQAHLCWGLCSFSLPCLRECDTLENQNQWYPCVKMLVYSGRVVCLQLSFAQHGLCVPPRFTLTASIGGQDVVLPSGHPVWAFYRCFQRKANQQWCRQSCYLKVTCYSNHPSHRSAQLVQDLGMIIVAKRSICIISSYYLIQHLGQNVRLLSCKSTEWCQGL